MHKAVILSPGCNPTFVQIEVELVWVSGCPHVRPPLRCNDASGVQMRALHGCEQASDGLLNHVARLTFLRQSISHNLCK